MADRHYYYRQYAKPRRRPVILGVCPVCLRTKWSDSPEEHEPCRRRAAEAKRGKETA